jgi:hypothetical protein
MHCPWWKYHEAAAMIKMAYTKEQRVFSENILRMECLFENTLYFASHFSESYDWLDCSLFK